MGSLGLCNRNIKWEPVLADNMLTKDPGKNMTTLPPTPTGSLQGQPKSSPRSFLQPGARKIKSDQDVGILNKGNPKFHAESVRQPPSKPWPEFSPWWIRGGSSPPHCRYRARQGLLPDVLSPRLALHPIFHAGQEPRLAATTLKLQHCMLSTCKAIAAYRHILCMPRQRGVRNFGGVPLRLTLDRKSHERPTHAGIGLAGLCDVRSYPCK